MNNKAKIEEFFKSKAGEVLKVIENECVEKPSIVLFKNKEKVKEILEKHILKGSKIMVHCDVDMDGLSSGKLFCRLMSMLGSINKILPVINKNKKHGIKNLELDTKYCELLIILDSSSNDIEDIKKIKTDVLVFDHHTLMIDEAELVGNTAKGEYAIITNQVEGEQGEIQKEMSGCQVLYEYIRYLMLVSDVIKVDDIDSTSLKEWVALTLYTDVIKMNNERNQWYINELINSESGEMAGFLSHFTFGIIGKSFINFSLSPLFNSAIRGGGELEALKIMLLNPSDLMSLEHYRQEQSEIVNKECLTFEEFDDYVLKYCDKEVPREYCGVIASRISDATDKSVLAYKINENGEIDGSFRGKEIGVDYRSTLDLKGISEARGHKEAFGLRIYNKENLNKVMNNINKEKTEKRFITFGDCIIEGSVHIDNFSEFKKDGWLVNLGNINARVSTSENIYLYYKGKDIEILETNENYYVYRVGGIKCISFKEIDESKVIKIYSESTNILRHYIR